MRHNQILKVVMPISADAQTKGGNLQVLLILNSPTMTEATDTLLPGSARVIADWLHSLSALRSSCGSSSAHSFCFIVLQNSKSLSDNNMAKS